MGHRVRHQLGGRCGGRASSSHTGAASLAEVLLAVRRHGPRRVIVEAKPVDDDALGVRTAAALGAVLAAAGRSVDVTVSSFDPALLLRIRRAVATDARPHRPAR